MLLLQQPNRIKRDRRERAAQIGVHALFPVVPGLIPFASLRKALRDLARSIFYCVSALATDEGASSLPPAGARVFVSGHRAAIVLGCVLWSK
jgi:hypothetical protein